MSVPTVLAKALYDNIADSADELTFRKGDVITVLEKDIDGLFGWWLCSLHGRQGIAPGNRLTEIGAGPRVAKASATSQQGLLDELDYAVPRAYEDPGEDYDVPRSVLSPQDYDIPKPDEKFQFKSEESTAKIISGVKDSDGNIYQEIYDVPTLPSPDKTLQSAPFKDVIQDIVSAKAQSDAKPKSDTSSAIHASPQPLAKPPRASKMFGEKTKATPPPRPPKPSAGKLCSPSKSVPTGAKEGTQERSDTQDEGKYSIPAREHVMPGSDGGPVSDVSYNPGDKTAPGLSGKPVLKETQALDENRENKMSEKEVKGENENSGPSESRTLPEDIYKVPTSDVTPGDIYDVPPALKQYQADDIYDTPPRIPTGLRDRPLVTPPKMTTGSNERGEQTPRKTTDINHNKKYDKTSDDNRGMDKSRSGSFGRSSGSSGRVSTDSGLSLDVNYKRSSNGSKRSSNSSTGSAKHSSDSDDYVDYQEIYGDGQEKHVNIYDVPVQHVQVSEIETAPVEKKTTASILQRINMDAVKGLKLDSAGALQRLSKLEQAVDVTVTKLLSHVTSKWRDPVLLRTKISDIRDIAGKGKVALRLLTEFGLSTLANARSLENQELSGKLSRAIEPLLETYYSLKLALQRLDDTEWKSPLERPNDGHDDLDLIMVYIRSVPEDSQKLVAIVRTTATVLFSRPSKPVVLLPAKENRDATPTKVITDVKAVNSSENKEKKQQAAPPPTKPKPNREIKAAENGEPKPSENDAKREEKDVPISNVKVAEVVAKAEKFGLSSEKLESDPNESSASVLSGDNKEDVEHNVKPSEVFKKFGSPQKEKPQGAKPANGETDGVPNLPPRRPSIPTKNAPAPPQRRDSGGRLQHVRQKSLERFVPEVDPSQVVNAPPNPPPKPKLDRHKTMRKSYKYPLRHDKVALRDTPPGSPTTPKRKCNSDPTDLDIAELEEMKEKRSSDSLDEKHQEGSLSEKMNTVHVSDSDLPSGLSRQTEVSPLSPKVDPSNGLRPTVQRSKSFSRTKIERVTTTMGQESGFGEFMLSFSDKELLEFYKYEIDAQLFVLNEAMRGLFNSVESGQPPKTFVSNSKFVVLSAHKFIYIGDTLHRKIHHDKLGIDITSATTRLSECVKTLVHATKMAALQYPATNPMRELTGAAVQVSDASIALHKVVKAGKSTD
ncbi:enhancer of filamentation 1 isoform X2 [Nematostella vectensis]|uniref:enhancer of filamentation 1 isoform X2 n=1 Tax=Nematostella vectensis TaxID=45351 RepID=UPI0020779279|nr:enhancer of filamentation 1 isoform X2 [Nematostella vectensis]